MSNAKTHFPYNIGECPGCHKPLIGHVSADVNTTNVTWTGDDDGKPTAMMGVVFTGFKIDHDCQPRLTR